MYRMNNITVYRKKKEENSMAMLYRWVLGQAVRDYRVGIENIERQEEKFYRVSARRFFSINDVDFLTVCEYAEVCPKCVLEKVKNDKH